MRRGVWDVRGLGLTLLKPSGSDFGLVCVDFLTLTQKHTSLAKVSHSCSSLKHGSPLVKTDLKKKKKTNSVIIL